MEKLLSSIITLDVHFADKAGRSRHAWEIVHTKLHAVLMEEENKLLFPGTDSTELFNSLRRVLSLMGNNMSSREVNDVRGVIADAMDYFDKVAKSA